MFKFTIECTNDIDSVNIVFNKSKAVGNARAEEPLEIVQERQDRQEVSENFTDCREESIVKACPPKSFNADATLPEIPDAVGRRINVASNMRTLEV